MNREYTRAPHRRATSSGDDYSPHAALLIDFDNVTMGIRSNLGHEVRRLLDSDIIRGKVSVQRAYADWRRYPQYVLPLSEASIDLIYAPAYGSSKKNATDIRLAIDALELVFIRPEIGTFILLSGDSDFSSLVLKLKEYGKYVIGVGLQESSSDILVQNCDEYYSYNTISGLTSAVDGQPQRLDPWELVDRALERMVERDDVMRSDRLKQVMLEMDSTFDEKSQGFSKFNKFLAEAARRELVSLRKSENGQYEVSPGSRSRSAGGGATTPRPQLSEEAKPSGQSPSRRRGRATGRSREGRGAREAPAAREGPEGNGSGGPQRAEGSTPAPSAGRPSISELRSAYDMLRDSVRKLAAGGEPVRDSEVKRKILAEDGQFDEGALGFRKFSRFLQQAHDEGVVDLTQGEDGNYYLTIPETAADEATAAERPGRSGRDRKAAESRREPRAERPSSSRQPVEADEPAEAETAAASAAEAAAEAREGRPAVEPGVGGAARAEAEVVDEERVGRRGLGRFRRGSRGPDAAEVGAGPSIGPVDVASGAEREEATVDHRSEEAPGTDIEGERDAAPGAEGAGRKTAASARRGLGRFRRGSRGRPPAGEGPAGRSSPGPTLGPVAAPSAEGAPEGDSPGRPPTGADSSAEGEAATEAEPPAGAESSATAEPSADGAVEHMIRNYSGVGRRTAERLVEEFGERVFEVIDQEPRRVTDLLSEHRARAVLEAREAERESGSTPGV